MRIIKTTDPVYEAMPFNWKHYWANAVIQLESEDNALPIEILILGADCLFDVLGKTRVEINIPRSPITDAPLSKDLIHARLILAICE